MNMSTSSAQRFVPVGQVTCWQEDKTTSRNLEPAGRVEEQHLERRLQMKLNFDEQCISSHANPTTKKCRSTTT